MKRLLTVILICAYAACFAASRRMQHGNNPALVTDWARRVVINGGPMPSQNTIIAMETLRTGMISAGLTNKIYSLCVFVPDSLTAARTPLFLHLGSDPWTNTGPFMDADLTINGLKGDGSTKCLNTGVRFVDIVNGANGFAVGFTVLVTEQNFNSGITAMGVQEADGDPFLELNVSFVAQTTWFPFSSSSTHRILTNDFERVGYVSGNRWVASGTTNVAIFWANPIETHKATTALTGHILGVASASTETVSVFSTRQNLTNRAFSSQRLSVAMVHNGFTEAESAVVWPLFQACRESLGGGTGDPVHDWNRRQVALGGANVSINTSNAARTFLSGVQTDGLYYKLNTVNVFVPDNLTAARTPLIWQGGGAIWTNTNFGTTNLTVNGLQGNATDKWLHTGFVTEDNQLRGFGNTSAGVSVLMFANPDTAGNFIMGSSGAVNDQFAIFSFAGTGLFRCWSTASVNANFLRASVGTTTNGWLSGSRTAADAIALYKARADTAHVLVTNSTTAQSASINTIIAPFVFAGNNGAGTPGAFIGATISFMAIHPGLTQTETSNLYVRVNTLRTALGGGSP